MMWQEARKQEKKIRGMLVDYKRRAERRKDYYEKIRADPTQFIQVHGRPCKIHLDPAVAIAADSPSNMMPWQGNQDILIDRFDVRAHLDFIPETKTKKEEEEVSTQEDRLINYERYRILAQNDFLGVSEEKFLHQLSVEEQFGPVEKVEPQPIEGKKKVVGAAIGYNYNEGSSTPVAPVSEGVEEKPPSSEEDDDDEDSDIDFDLCVDVNKISSAQAHEMNASALSYGMVSNDFFSFLTRDVEEAENLKMAREREEEKAMFSGRKSRRERRAFREKKLIGRKLSPPSYAASKEAPIADLIRNVSKSRSRTHSRSASPPNAGMIQYITSFGGEEPPLENPPPQIIKTSVHTSKKEEGAVYKRTVRYRSSKSPERNYKRLQSKSDERLVRYQSRSKDWIQGYSACNSLRTTSPSQNWRSKSPTMRRVRYRSRSRSHSPHHGARSYDRAKSSKEYELSSSITRKKQKSRSPTPTIRVVKKSSSPQPVRSIEIPAPPVITRYYGRHKNESSSSEIDLSDSGDKSDQTSDKTSAPSPAAVGNSCGRSKVSIQAAKVSLQERLKKKRQALINRQYKADKRAERLRLEKAEQERQDREDEMREMSIKMRRRERQKRHRYYELDESNTAENSDDEGLSDTSSGTASDTESQARSKTSVTKNPQDIETKPSSRERDKSKDSDSKKDTGPRREGNSRRESERPFDRDSKRGREDDQSKGRDEERHRRRERSKERTKQRSRSRERERTRKDRECLKGGSRDKSRERDRHSNRSSTERESRPSAKKPFKPLVDY